MSRFAQGTTVTAQKTQGDIMGLLGKRGVSKIATFSDDKSFSIAFEYEGVPYRISLPIPDPEDKRFTHYKQRGATYERSEGASKELYNKEVNRIWRAFGMVIKAKLVAVEEGISTMQAEFIGNCVLRGGRTVAETYADDLPQLAQEGRVSALALPGGSNV